MANPKGFPEYLWRMSKKIQVDCELEGGPVKRIRKKFPDRAQDTLGSPESWPKQGWG